MSFTIGALEGVDDICKVDKKGKHSLAMDSTLVTERLTASHEIHGLSSIKDSNYPNRLCYQ